MTLKLKVMYNDMELSKYLYVVADGFDRSVIGDRTNTTVKVGHAVGETFLDTTKGMRRITMPFYINKDIPDALEKIAQIVNVEEPKQLIFGDEPDWYYSAIVDGTLSFTRLEREGSGTITWLVPDMYKHAVNSTTYSNDGADKSRILFDNNSNASTPVNVRVKMKSDNGFLGLSLNGAYYQVGIPEQVDGVQLPPSEQLVDNGVDRLSQALVNNTTCQPLPAYMGHLSQTGTVSKTNNGLEVTNYGTSPDKSWAGPSLTWKFPPTDDGHVGAKNLFLWQDVCFETSALPEAGLQVHTLSDKDGKRLFSVIYIDQSGTINQSKIIAFVNDKKVYETNNYWTSTGYKGFMSMTKSGNNFVLVYGNTTKTFVDPDLENAEAMYYTIGYGKWYNNPAPQHNWLAQWKLRQDKINIWKDIPNFFANGDVVQLNSENNELTINGVPNWDRVDVGSEPFNAKIGSNILGVVASNFAKTPDVTLTFNERKL